MATYDPTAPPCRQQLDWTCSCNSAAWMLRALGYPVDGPTITNEMLERGLVSPEWGLMDGSGTQLAAYLEEYTGLPTHAVRLYPSADDWAWLQAHAGLGPIGMGSNTMYHWLAIRDVADAETLAGMNPAPGYQGVGDAISHEEFNYWAGWSCVWIDLGAQEEDTVACQEELAVASAKLASTEAALAASISQVGYLTGDLADQFQREADSLAAAPDLAAVATGVQHGLQPAIDTLRRGGG